MSSSRGKSAGGSSSGASGASSPAPPAKKTRVEGLIASPVSGGGTPLPAWKALRKEHSGKSNGCDVSDAVMRVKGVYHPQSSKAVSLILDNKEENRGEKYSVYVPEDDVKVVNDVKVRRLMAGCLIVVAYGSIVGHDGLGAAWRQRWGSG
jgi:hypothetical protein